MKQGPPIVFVRQRVSRSEPAVRLLTVFCPIAGGGDAGGTANILGDEFEEQFSIPGACLSRSATARFGRALPRSLRRALITKKALLSGDPHTFFLFWIARHCLAFMAASQGDALALAKLGDHACPGVDVPSRLAPAAETVCAEPDAPFPFAHLDSSLEHAPSPRTADPRVDSSAPPSASILEDMATAESILRSSRCFECDEVLYSMANDGVSPRPSLFMRGICAKC
jgi:hypothetical protein